jgi:hypothetical protein
MNKQVTDIAVNKMLDLVGVKLRAGASTNVGIFGDLRTLLNRAASTFKIANGEVGSSVRAKLNGWHNLMDRLFDKVFCSENFCIWADPPQVANASIS